MWNEKTDFKTCFFYTFINNKAINVFFQLQLFNKSDICQFGLKNDPLKIKETSMKSIDNQPNNFFTEVNISFTFYAISWEYIFQVFKLIKSC